MSREMIITISVDDVHPESGWGLPDDSGMIYMEKLNKEFGCKFTLFIPSNFHRKYPLSKYKSWIKWLKTKDYFELAAHGHYHQCERSDIGECEFLELDTPEKAKERIRLCLTEWNSVTNPPKGWRNPGWVTHPNNVDEISKYFKYVALHNEHNRGINWKCKEIYGHNGINETDVNINGNVIMFQSHISGDWNDNVWNEKNYKQLQLSLGFLKKNNYIKYKTLSEL